MAVRIQQLFVKSSDADAIVAALHTYVTEYGTKFTPHPRYRLNGVEEVLRHLVVRKRDFLLYTEASWTAVWEIVHHSEFADPGIVKFLAKQMKTEALWIQLDQDYNIWAYQYFVKGSVKSEVFLPRRYFLGDYECPPGRRGCLSRAEEFNASRKLPAFLVSLSALERSPKKYPGLKSIKCPIPK